MCGDATRAERLAAETSERFPDGTIWNAVQLPEIRATIALNRDQPARSVELLASASPYERSYLEATYLRGLAYLRLRKGAGAAAEFQKIVGHPRRKAWQPGHPKPPVKVLVRAALFSGGGLHASHDAGLAGRPSKPAVTTITSAPERR